ncbi:RNA-directed DNA polymerase, eukaryota [Tanacetum coccineum]
MTTKQETEKSANNIIIQDGNFAWDLESTTPTLRNVNLEVKRGQKVTVCGPKICIQSGKLQDNILYGKPMNRIMYEKAIKACALDKDIEAFKHGDLTEIGQRGLNMSGGQKQRIQLARAVYNDPDIYLLDDPFSSVDAHTAATLFNNCVMTSLEKKTVILVTHKLEFLSSVDNILLTEEEEKAVDIVEWKPFVVISEGLCVCTLLSALSTIFVFLRSFLVTLLGLKASKSFFNKFTDSVFNAPMVFFDSTPIGRILTRGYYEPTTMEIMRINGTTKAPVMNYVSQTSLGVATIREFKMQDRFFKEYLKLVDTDASTFLFSNATLEWFVLRTKGFRAFSNCGEKQATVFLAFQRKDTLDLKLRYRPNAPLVLKGITCTFKEGTRVGIVGRTGSGKTALITALFRLVKPDSGKILIDGLNICSIGLKDLRMKLSVIPQEPTLFRGSIRTNLDPLGLHSDDEIWKNEFKGNMLMSVVSMKAYTNQMTACQTINLDSHMFQKISIYQNADLESDVSLEEIKKAVWECGTNKSPGPDGFSFEFIRKYWNIIQHDVVNAVKEFFSSSKFPPGSNSSFITLIPKSLDAKMVKDFRPISLIGSFYKIVAKILSNRLCIVMPDLISDVQTAFISKRQILDGPFILNELISWCKYHKIKAMIFKADFEKAFDSVRWDYLDGVLNNFGFGVKWRGWIQACLSSAMGSILVNGSPSSEFKFHKGLKQGDPLSPFLFILVMESLHISFNNILNSGLYKGIRIDESLTLSHLFYADDAVFIGKWDKANVITIVNMLKCFYLASGLKINIQKSKIMGIGTSQEEVDVAANVIGCNTFSSPFNYLGVKVGSSSSRSNFWDEVIAKLSSRLSKWKIKMLSIGGRFTLNKAVLSSLPIYLMSIYKTPVGVLRKMESIRRRFFNGADINENKMSMIGWEKIMVSRKKGGLGISSFFAQNRALLFKWIWRFRSKDSSLWYRVIKAMFGDGGALDNTGKFARSSTWTTIVRECGNLSSKGINLLSHMKRKVGNGLNTLFWVDSWLTDIPLKQLYPRMFALDCNKNSTVAEKINASSISCSFRRLPRGSLEEEQFSKLIEDVNSVILSVSNDRWIWSLDSSGEFSIKSTRLFIDDHLLLAVGAPTRWVSEVPIKINIMAWKVSLDKLPTRLNLSLRGIEIPSITCPICSCAGESCSHLFFSCSMARNITTKLARWWEFDCPDLFSYDDWLEWFHTLRLLKGFKDILEGVFYVMWWVIWKYRNQTLFGSSKPHMDMLFDEIVFLSFTWCSNRCKNNFDWISWMKCPRSLSL